MAPLSEFNPKQVHVFNYSFQHKFKFLLHSCLFIDFKNGEGLKHITHTKDINYS